MDTSYRAIKADSAIIELAATIARTEGMAAVMAAQAAVADADPLASDVAERLKSTRPGYKEFGDRKMLASAPAMYSSMLRAITDVSTGIDRLAALATITVPTLVIVGEADAPSRKPSERMAEAIPGAGLAVIPGGAPAPQLEGGGAGWAEDRKSGGVGKSGS